MRTVKYLLGLCAVITTIGISSAITGQTTTSTIEGTVTDPNGAVVARATVKGAGINLAPDPSAVTDNSGFYGIN